MYAKDNTKNLFKLANSVAENFVSNNLSDYQGLRNYDYGPEKRNNVSCLSPFITHRILSEYDLNLSKTNKTLDWVRPTAVKLQLTARREQCWREAVIASRT